MYVKQMNHLGLAGCLLGGQPGEMQAYPLCDMSQCCCSLPMGEAKPAVGAKLPSLESVLKQ